MCSSARPEVLALLAECKDHPNDDTPRLILADFLEDSPLAVDRARGQFVRLQCRLARMTVTDPERPAVQASIREQRRQHEVDWVESLVLEDLITDWWWDRGLLAVEVQGRQLLNCRAPGMADSEALAWVETLHLDIKNQPEVLPLTLECPLARGITVLDLSRTDPLASMESLAQSPALRRIRKLDLSGTEIGWDSLRYLARSEHLVGLEHLLLNGVRGRFWEMEALAQCPALGRLAILEISRNQIGLLGLNTLAMSQRLPRLAVVRMEYDQSDPLNAPHPEVDCPGYARFRQLHLGNNPEWHERFQRFATLPSFAGSDAFALESVRPER